MGKPIVLPQPRPTIGKRSTTP
jgi:hypothetical protein